MMHAYASLSRKTIQREVDKPDWSAYADICVVGGGISGIYAAIAASRLGKSVILIDADTQLGGLTYNANIGSFCGFYSNGVSEQGCIQLTNIIAAEMFEELKRDNGIFARYSSETIIAVYDDLCFLRWAEHKILECGIQLLLGCTVSEVRKEGKRLKSLIAISRYGNVTVHAEGFVDASGDAALAWLADLPCCVSGDVDVLGSQMFILKEVNCWEGAPTTAEINQCAEKKGHIYGIERKKGVFFYIPERGGTFYGNMTHVKTPLDPIKASTITLTGKDEADKVVNFLKAEFPETFARSSIQKYGGTGIRQTRTVASVGQLTHQGIMDAVRFGDSIARTSWPVELHNQSEAYLWHTFGSDHIHYIPLSCMLSSMAENYVAAGRCIDADTIALSSVRVMGPCAATGTAAAYSLALAGSGSIHNIKIEMLQGMLKENLNSVR